MKIEIEVTEDRIISTIVTQVKTAIRDYASSYWVDQNIKDVIKKYWDETVENIVCEELKNLESLRETVRRALVNKIKGQLTALYKDRKIEHDQNH